MDEVHPLALRQGLLVITYDGGYFAVDSIIMPDTRRMAVCESRPLHDGRLPPGSLSLKVVTSNAEAELPTLQGV